jgi:hypothetical protein
VSLKLLTVSCKYHFETLLFGFTGGSPVIGFLGFIVVLLELQAFHKAVNLPGGINDTLLTGEERMAVRAKVSSDIPAFFGRAGLPGSTTGGANHGGYLIARMNSRFHF